MKARVDVSEHIRLILDIAVYLFFWKMIVLDGLLFLCIVNGGSLLGFDEVDLFIGKFELLPVDKSFVFLQDLAFLG